jgi:sulfur-oxidizing protein SoxY
MRNSGTTRRRLLRSLIKAGAVAGWAGLLAEAGLFAGAGLAAPARAAEADWATGPFAARNLREAVKALGGTTPIETPDVSWGNTPDIAENGQVVPISITSRVPKTDTIAIVIEKNPNPMAAVFEVLPGTDPSFRTNFKLGESSNVYALVKADGRFYVSTHEIKVTIGGCGG